jgi:hypothetical protein
MQAVSARPIEVRTAGRRPYVQNLDRTQRRSGTVPHEPNTVQEPGRAAWGQLDRTNTQCGYEIVTDSILSDDADHR